MLILNAEEQKKLIDMNEVIDYVAVALKEFSSGRTVTPIRAALPFRKGENTSLVMPSVAEELESVGLKVVTVAPNNKKIGKKTINGVVMLSDFETGEPISLLEGSHLTMVRTGALSGVATKYLSREDSKKLCVIGTGEQAKGLVASVLAVREIEEVLLYNLLAPIQEGVFNSEDIYGELGRIVNGELKGRNSDQEITVFESVGVAVSADKVVVEAIEAALEETVVDIIVAQYIYDKALKNNVGTTIQL
ncbi:ornithine cyclodeaminase [Halobacillus sp. Marseille-P3879]|uniref:ornithine cyclodeaminase n=1 Tax=Halobacillus sp. Marseille-P3879 TaxID=2045014 RepID=UPI000C7B3014|nr:ornithine cyclodeaminase [Halobacillus sp. Marseille-P3879]